MTVGAQTTVRAMEEVHKEAQDYYDSEAFEFYTAVWGGNNIHIGLYSYVENPEQYTDKTDLIREAGEITVTHLGKLIPSLPPTPKIMDMGSALGGLARFFVKEHDATVICIDLSAKENQRNRELSTAAGLIDKIIIPGELSFTETQQPDESVDVVVSQDSLLHAGEYRAAAVKEAYRVLKKGGAMVFHDLLEAEGCDKAEMKPVYERIHLNDLASVPRYEKWAAEAGFKFVKFEDQSKNMRTHYQTVHDNLIAKRESLKGKVSDEYCDKMLFGLNQWVSQADKGNVQWGYFVLLKE